MLLYSPFSCRICVCILLHLAMSVVYYSLCIILSYIFSLNPPLLDLSDFLGLQGCPYSRILSPLRTESCVHLPPLLDTGSRQAIRKAPPLPYTLHPTLPPLLHCTPSSWMRTETQWP